MSNQHSNLLFRNELYRKALKMNNDNVFLKNLDFANRNFKIGSTLRIRLPNDYRVVTKAVEKFTEVVLSNKEIVVLGVAAVAAKNPVVSRRFWKR